MNQYCPVHTTKYKRPLLFRVELRLKSIELASSKASNLLFEFSFGKSIVHSKNFHRLDGQSYRANISETVELHAVVPYDPRKDRFSTAEVTINVLAQHPKFSKKIASASLSLSQILNARVLLSREKLKLERCADKSAYLNLTAELEYKGIATDEESIDKSYISAVNHSHDMKEDADDVPRFLLGTHVRGKLSS